jgi:CRISPR-associated protein Csx10
MKYLRFDLTLRSPAIASTLSGDPNSIATQLFIPGSAIRGALAARLIATGEDSDGERFRRLILSGAVRYLHAYPKINGARSLPIPLSWKSPKNEADKNEAKEAIDLANYPGTATEDMDVEDFGDAWPKSALASCGGAFVSASVSSGQRTLDGVRVGARIHQQRDRAKGRPWKDRQENTHGAIFAYEYLEEGQTFTGLIQVTDAALADLDRIKTLLAEPMLIGRSRRSGYGGEAVISALDEIKREFAGATGQLNQDVATGTHFRVLLTSSYIGRHPDTGQVDPTAIERELVEALGGRVILERRRWAFETVGGFNRKWGLETPQVMAVRGGSILVLRAVQDIQLDALRAVEHDGLGERRVEGFGRVVFLEHADDRNASIWLISADDSTSVASSGQPSAAPDPQLEFLEKRLVLNAARAELDRVARLDVASTATQLPTNSLLARLRAPLRGALDEASAAEALGTLARWCDTGDRALKDNAKEKLRDCKVKINGRAESLLDWIKGLVTVPNGQTGWAVLLAATGNAASVSSLATHHHLTSLDAAEGVLKANAATLRVHLLDAVLAAMARKNRRGDG